MESNLVYLYSGPAFSRLNRLLIIEPHAQGAPRYLLTYANLHFLSKLFAQYQRRPTVFLSVAFVANENKIRSVIVTAVIVIQ